MDKKVQKLWTNALSSGEYKQITGRLRNSQGYCPLGVLCDLYRGDRGGEWVRDPRDYYGISYGFSINRVPYSNYLPLDVSMWSGLTACDPFFFHEKKERIVTLSSLNDAGVTFPEIAEIIDRFL